MSCEGPLVELGEVVGGVAEAVPLEAEPADVFLDGVDVLLLFFFGVGVVEAQVGFAAELVGEAEVDADGLGVADVEVAVGLGGKAGLDDGVAVFFGADVLGDDVVEEVGGGVGWAWISGFALVMGLPNSLIIRRLQVASAVDAVDATSWRVGQISECMSLAAANGFQAAALPAGMGWATKRTPSAAQTRLMVSKRGALSGRRAL